MLFNKAWKDLLEAATGYLAGNQDYIIYSNCCNKCEMRINAEPYIFSADVGYEESKDVTIEARIEEIDD